MSRPPAPRGNALVITLISLSVLMALVLGVITFTGRNQVAAASKERADRLTACADTARRYLLSRLRVFGATVPVSELRLENVRLLDDADPSHRTVIRTGHYGESDTPESTVAEVPTQSMGSAGRQVRDLTNTLPSSGLVGGSYYRVVVMCEEHGGQQTETEFLFRFGL